jgi:hypothetical protein
MLLILLSIILSVLCYKRKNFSGVYTLLNHHENEVHNCVINVRNTKSHRYTNQQEIKGPTVMSVHYKAISNKQDVSEKEGQCT